MNIPTNTVLKIQDKKYIVKTAVKLRKNYIYLLEDEHNNRVSVKRSRLLELINTGEAQIV